MELSKFFGMLFVASLAMASCSNDDITGDGPDINGGVSGEKTWAMLNFSIGEAVGTRANGIGENGSESTSVGSETAVESLDLYIFNQAGKLELKKTYSSTDLVNNTDADYDASKLASSTPMEVTSGTKTFCVILNQQGAPSATVGSTTLSEFLQAQRTADDYTSLTTGGLLSTTSMMMTGTAEVTLHSGISKEKVTNALSSNTNLEANNVVTLYVNRNAAKLDLKLGSSDATTSLPVGEVSAPLATFSNVQYKVNNLSKNTYYFLQSEDANGVYPTPGYSLPDGTSNWGNNWFEMENSDYKSPGETIYLSENTHEQGKAVVGNTTYVLVNGVYVPTDSKYIVDGYDHTTRDFTYTANTLEAGKRAIFSYEYSVAFPSFAGTNLGLTASDNTAISDYIKALVARRVAEKYSIESDIKAADVVFCGDEAGYTTAIATPQSAVYAYLEQVKINGETKEGNYAVVMKRWNVKMGDTDATEDANFNLAPLTIGVYNTASDGASSVGLNCYYRINVFTYGYAKAHPMYYSVMRNVSYHVDIQSVAKIGENDGGNVDLPGEENQEQPVGEATTFMQCKINVYKWVGKNMDIEDLGK